MTTLPNKIESIHFRADADALEFWIPSEFTTKMMELFRHKDIRVTVQMSPMEGNEIMHYRDEFRLVPVGKPGRRAKIKQLINQFCAKHGLQTANWPSEF